MPSNVAARVAHIVCDHRVDAQAYKMMADMTAELKPHGVAVVSLYPRLVRTKKVLEAAQWLDLSNIRAARVHRTRGRGARG